MRTPRLALLVLSLSVLSARAARALEDVILNDGSVHRAEILAVNEDSIRVRFSPKSGGTAELVVPAAKLDPHFFYGLRDKAAGDDAKAHLKLALWAVEAGLFSRARAQVAKAAELDPQLVKDIEEGKLPEIREGIATKILESAREDAEAGRLEMAEKKLELLLARLPDTDAGTSAVEDYQALAPRLEEARAKAEQAERERLDEAARKADEERAKLFEDVDKDVAEGRKDLRAGLTEDSEQQTLVLLGRAITHGESALKRLERLAKDHPDDAVLAKKIEEYRLLITRAMVNAHLKRADVYTWRGATNDARQEIAAARELDPENPDLATAEQAVDYRESDDALGLRWQRERRAGLRFKAGGAGRAAGGGGRRR
jgi:tetratricopeptide (TPR) repeat protein